MYNMCMCIVGMRSCARVRAPLSLWSNQALCVYIMCITLYNMSCAELIVSEARRTMAEGRLAKAEETNDDTGWS